MTPVFHDRLNSTIRWDLSVYDPLSVTRNPNRESSEAPNFRPLIVQRNPGCNPQHRRSYKLDSSDGDLSSTRERMRQQGRRVLFDRIHEPRLPVPLVAELLETTEHEVNLLRWAGRLTTSFVTEPDGSERLAVPAGDVARLLAAGPVC